jgi:hypothetical protein
MLTRQHRVGVRFGLHFQQPQPHELAAAGPRALRKAVPEHGGDPRIACPLGRESSPHGEDRLIRSGAEMMKWK